MLWDHVSIVVIIVKGGDRAGGLRNGKINYGECVTWSRDYTCNHVRKCAQPVRRLCSSLSVL